MGFCSAVMLLLLMTDSGFHLHTRGTVICLYVRDRNRKKVEKKHSYIMLTLIRQL